MALTKVIGAGLGTVTEDQVFGGATPTVTIGDAGAEDAKIVFDGNAQDYHIGLDDSADTLVIGKGSALGTTTAMSFDANGIIPKPIQPAFLAQPASQQANIGEGSEIDIAFGTERFDQNGDFASSVFTAPVTGKYFLSYSLWISNIDSVPSYFETYLTTSNRQYLHTFDPRGLAQDAGSRTINNALVADMDAGDTAKIQILIQSSGTVQSDVENYSFFSGYLVA